MDNLGIFLRRQARKLLDSSIQQLKEGIISSLSQNYTSLYGEEKAFHLSIALLNECLLEEPVDMDNKIFRQNHTELIDSELLKLSEDENISKALSYLYAAETLFSAPAAKKTSSKHLQELTEQASGLNIHIPDSNEICGSAEINECVIEIMKFAAGFYLETHTEPDDNMTDGTT